MGAFVWVRGCGCVFGWVCVGACVVQVCVWVPVYGCVCFSAAMCVWLCVWVRV